MNGAMSEAVRKQCRCPFVIGDRVIDDQGESGTLGRETFHGPWPGFELGWWVNYDRDYTTRMLAIRLQRITVPIQDKLFEDHRKECYDK
jgi:hypothetical protein